MSIKVEVDNYTIPSTGFQESTNNSVESREDIISGWTNVLADTLEESALAKLWTSLLCSAFADEGIDPLTGHLNGYSIQQASWAAAVAKLLDGEETIDPLAETGASAGIAGMQLMRDGTWEAHWAGGCRIIRIDEMDFGNADFCQDPQPFESPSLNSLQHASLPLNNSSGSVAVSSLFVICDSFSADWVRSHLRSHGMWESAAALAGYVGRARLDGILGNETVSLIAIEASN